MYNFFRVIISMAELVSVAVQAGFLALSETLKMFFLRHAHISKNAYFAEYLMYYRPPQFLLN